MKKSYIAPEYEILVFETEDVITTSVVGPGSNDGAFDDGFMD